MNIAHAIRLAPPRREPWQTVMLIDNKIKFLLPTIPGNGLENGTGFSTTANNVNTFEDFFASAAGEIVGVPIHLVSALDERHKMRQRHPFRATRERILRVTPIEHQETHGRS